MNLEVLISNVTNPAFLFFILKHKFNIYDSGAIAAAYGLFCDFPFEYNYRHAIISITNLLNLKIS